ncbi:MAG: DUF4238 domain-containing protein [Acidobacteriota bacterium]
MTFAKRHHLVPEFFLERFAKDNKVLVVSRNNLKDRFLSSVDNALVQRHFYSLDFEEGKDLTVERMFDTEVESPASRAIRRVVDQRRSTTLPALRRAISTFLAFQFVRGTATREASILWYQELARHTGKIATPEIVKAELERQGEVMSLGEAQELVDFAREGDYRIDISPKANVHLRGALPNALEVIPFFERRTWMVLDFDQPRLISSDEPIVLIGDSRAVGEPTGVGTAGEIVVVTDPSHALVLVRPDKNARECRSPGTAAMADLINKHVAFNAHRYVVCHPDCVPLQGFTLPKKADPVMVLGDQVVTQLRTSVRARREWLKKHKAPSIR